MYVFIFTLICVHTYISRNILNGQSLEAFLLNLEQEWTILKILLMNILEMLANTIKQGSNRIYKYWKGDKSTLIDSWYESKSIPRKFYRINKSKFLRIMRAFRKLANES